MVAATAYFLITQWNPHVRDAWNSGFGYGGLAGQFWDGIRHATRDGGEEAAAILGAMVFLVKPDNYKAEPIGGWKLARSPLTTILAMLPGLIVGIIVYVYWPMAWAHIGSWHHLNTYVVRVLAAVSSVPVIGAIWRFFVIGLQKKLPGDLGAFFFGKKVFLRSALSVQRAFVELATAHNVTLHWPLPAEIRDLQGDIQYEHKCSGKPIPRREGLLYISIFMLPILFFGVGFGMWLFYHYIPHLAG